MARLLFSVILLAAAAHPQDKPIAVLDQCCVLSPDDIKTLDQGRPIGRLIKFGDDADIAIMGAIRLSVPKEAFLRWYRNVENYKYSELVEQAVPFHVPPRPEDVATFVIDANQLKLMRECKPAGCGFKLSRETISQLQSQLDWSQPGVGAKAESLARSVLLRYVTRYVQQGDAALAKYNDKPEEIDVRGTFRELLQSSPYVKAAFPALYDRLWSYPGAAQSGQKDDLFYWSRERYGFGLKSLINVSHTTTFQASPAVTVLANRQIWASHYYDGSLSVTVLVDANPGTYLVFLNRSRIDLLKSGGLKRWLVKRFAPGAIRKEVTALKRQVEAQP